MRSAISMALVLGLAAALTATAARAADAVKPGRWEFSSRMQLPGMPKLPPGVTLPPGTQLQQGGMAVTHTQCVDPEKAVPSDPRRECKVDKMERNGGVITWSTTCESPQGTVRSAGSARYSGDTMEASLNTRAPNGKDGYIDTMQHITGRYLGPCDAAR